MCGIAGIYYNGGAVREAYIDALEQSLLHRGPDGTGRYTASNCALVHTRLAIIDIEGGDQPFVSKAGKDEIALIANGEIYNNLELRSELSDVSFQSRSDCEPPLHLYLRDGVGYAKKLRGMYAIAIWDERFDRLVLSRDPFGIKPLYYIENDAGFAFASEPRALINAGLENAELNDSAIEELTALQFSNDRETAFKGIYRVAPGETLVIEKGEIIESHIQPALPSGEQRSLSGGSAVYELDKVLSESVNVHQRSDVPYGMFLSGGVDSSALLALMNRLNEQPVLAFSAGFPGTGVTDEREHARELAKISSADHIEVEVNADDLWETLPKIARHMDDPVADYAIIPTWKLAKAAAERNIKVVLTGEGGDEMFAGYGRYRTATRMFFPREMYRRSIFQSMDVLRDDDSKRRWRDGLAHVAKTEHSDSRTRLQVAQATDIATWLPNDLLLKVDRMLMAHGIEGRVPFIDKEVAEFAFMLPDGHKVHHGMGKWILRKWLETALAQARPFSKKRGFTVPVGPWMEMRARALGEKVARQPGVSALCRPGAVEGLFQANHAKAQKAQWTLLFYAVWHQVHFRGADENGGIFDIL